MQTIDLLGWAGSLCLACCAVPQAILSWRQGHSRGISDGLLILWCLGEVFTLAYILKTSGSLPLLVNYSANILFIGIVAWYRIYPRETLANPIDRS